MTKKEKADINIKDGFYIQNLEARKIYLDNFKNKQSYTTYDKPRRNIYTGTLSYSLDEIKLCGLYPKEFYIKDSKQFSDAVININFDKDLNKASTEKKKIYQNNEIKEVNTRGEQIISKEGLREYFYTNGMTVNDINYKLFKRSVAKSRQGSCLFINEKYHSEMLNWSRLNIDFKEDEMIDLSSLKAYESLSLSALESIITIQPNQILMIDDDISEFYEIASVTELIDKKPVTTIKEVKIKNTVWDGESLIDISILPPDSDKSMWLLRNNMFKSAGFAARIGQFFLDRGITEVDDKYRGCKIDVKNIKLIITPSSLKLSKFEDKFPDKDYFSYWINHIKPVFGICKNEKKSRWENRQKISYQFLNSIPAKIKDVEKICAEEIKYINSLKNDILVFLDYCDLNMPKETYTFIQNLISVNINAQYTNMFKEYRSHTIADYVKEVRKGRIKIKNSDYCILFSNGLELLKKAAGDSIKPLHTGYEVWCSKYSDNKQFSIYRNPHIASGNTCLVKNKYHEEFDKYFRLSDNIIIVNSYNSDLPDTLQGADFDSDSVLACNDPLIIKKVKEVSGLPAPINRIKFDTLLRKNNPHQSADIDNIIQESQNYIGIICNCAQTMNSYYWDEFFKPTCDNEKLKSIYSKVSMLSSLSQIEIDRPKRMFQDEDLNMKVILRQLSKVKFNGESINKFGTVYKMQKLTPDMETSIKAIKKLLSEGSITKKTHDNQIQEKICIPQNKPIKPDFFKRLKVDRKKNFFLKLNCPMDYLQTVLNKKIKYAKKTDTVNISDILIDDKQEPDRHKAQKIIKILYETKEQKNYLYTDKTKDKHEINNQRQVIIDLAILEISKLKISRSTMLNIYARIIDPDHVKNYDNKYELRNFVITALSILHKAHPKTSMECFQEIKTDMRKLVKLDNKNEKATHIFWDIKYKSMHNA